MHVLNSNRSKAGAVSLILSALRTHAANEFVMEWALKSLYVLAAGMESIKVSLLLLT